MNVFYSWQSDLDRKSNYYFIRDCLKEAAESLNNAVDIGERVNVDSDTMGVAGSPNIAQTIFDKIDRSDIFVCDISTINHQSDSRKTPNPNVLIELGYAIRAIGWSKIICVVNEEFSSVPDDLPFDLRGQRVTRYKLGSDRNNKSVVTKEFTSTMKIALIACASSFPSEIFHILDKVNPQIRQLLMKGQSISLILRTETADKIKDLISKTPEISSKYLAIKPCQGNNDQLIMFKEPYTSFCVCWVLVPMPNLFEKP
jgi:hypothetical protein